MLKKVCAPIQKTVCVFSIFLAQIITYSILENRICNQLQSIDQQCQKASIYFRNDPVVQNMCYLCVAVLFFPKAAHNVQ